MKFFTEIEKNNLTIHTAIEKTQVNLTTLNNISTTEVIMVICARSVIIVIHRLKIE